MAVQPDARPTLAALADLRDRIADAIRDGHPPEEPALVAQVHEICELADWCRGAGLAWAREGFTWAELTNATGISDATLQDRWRRWYQRGGRKACG